MIFLQQKHTEESDMLHEHLRRYNTYSSCGYVGNQCSLSLRLLIS